MSGRTLETKLKISEALRKNANSTPFMHCGYLRISIHLRKGFRRIPLHRYIMEQHLGRRLKKHEKVHHIDNNRLNNAVENLLLCTNSSHLKIHRKTTCMRPKGYHLSKSHRKALSINKKRFYAQKRLFS